MCRPSFFAMAPVRKSANHAGCGRLHCVPAAASIPAATPIPALQRSPMPIELDHVIVPSHHKLTSARLLADLLGVPWAESALGPFSPVFVNEGLTLDFIETDEAFPVYHFCFRVSEADFDAILARITAAGIAYRSSVRGPMDMRVNTEYGGRMIYWNEPDGHQWEMLTVSYARAASPPQG